MKHKKTMMNNWCLIDTETVEILAMNKDRNILFSIGFKLMKLDKTLLLAVL